MLPALYRAPGPGNILERPTRDRGGVCVAIDLQVVRRTLAERYDVDYVLGRGTMADVFFGRERESGSAVAIKVLKPEFAVTLVGDRFHREVSILSRLVHPNILPLIDSGEERSVVYYVMPCATGGTLKGRLEKEERLSLEDAIAIARDVAAALDYSHSQGIVHRDIKPGNIVFEGGRSLICDFGIAKAMLEAAGDRISSSGLVVGTPHYMSPEQASGAAELDGRSDVYSLACVVFEMLIGEPPFTGASAQAVMAKHVRERPPSARVVRPEIPEHVESALSRALAKNAGERPGSGGELAGLLG